MEGAEEMSTELVKTWIEALRSGQYNQGKGYLKKIFKSDLYAQYCCLGVLCDLLDPLGWEENLYSSSPFLPHAVLYSWDDSTYLLPDSILDKIHLSSDEVNILIEVNDIGGSFDTIALILEHIFLLESRHFLRMTVEVGDHSSLTKSIKISCTTCEYECTVVGENL